MRLADVLAFFVDVDEGVAVDLSRSILLNQIIHHATDHRGQIVTTLSAHGVGVPDLSTWSWRKADEGQSLLAALRPGQRVANRRDTQPPGSPTSDS